MQKAKDAELVSASQYEKFVWYQLVEVESIQSVSEFGSITEKYLPSLPGETSVSLLKKAFSL